MRALTTVMDATMSFVLDERSVRALMLLTTVVGSMAATRPVKAARATEAKEKNFMMMVGGWVKVGSVGGEGERMDWEMRGSVDEWR
jgi:hypothetical protein